MSEQPGYMYQLKVGIFFYFLLKTILCQVSVISVKNGIDEYTLPVGLREVKEKRFPAKILFFSYEGQVDKR